MSRSEILDPAKQVIFASNNVTITVNAVFHGSLTIPGTRLPGKVLLLASGTKFELYIALAMDAHLSAPVATFGISKGLKGTIIPNQNAWIIPGIPSFILRDSGGVDNEVDNPLRIDTNLHLSFKSRASFWAFAYFLSGIKGPLPHNSQTGLNHALTFDEENLRNVMSSERVFEFPG